MVSLVFEACLLHFNNIGLFNYFPLKEGVIIYVNKVEFSSSNNALFKVWLKLAPSKWLSPKCDQSKESTSGIWILFEIEY